MSVLSECRSGLTQRWCTGSPPPSAGCVVAADASPSARAASVPPASASRGACGWLGCSEVAAERFADQLRSGGSLGPSGPRVAGAGVRGPVGLTQRWDEALPIVGRPRLLRRAISVSTKRDRCFAPRLSRKPCRTPAGYPKLTRIRAHASAAIRAAASAERLSAAGIGRLGGKARQGRVFLTNVGIRKHRDHGTTNRISPNRAPPSRPLSCSHRPIRLCDTLRLLSHQLLESVPVACCGTHHVPERSRLLLGLRRRRPTGAPRTTPRPHSRPSPGRPPHPALTLTPDPTTRSIT
jgi:hypothetical protein